MAKELDDQIYAQIQRIVSEAVAKTLKLVKPDTSIGVPTQYHCTGQSFRCSELYLCNDSKHSCSGIDDSGFECTNLFNCTGGPFTRVVGPLE